MLAQATDALPSKGALRAGVAFEPKFDGVRALIFTGAGPGEGVRVQSRRGTALERNFPDLVRAAHEQLPPGLVLDGELVVWSAEQLSFEALQRRIVSAGCTVERLARTMPAHFIAFDVLQADARELLGWPYRERRAALEKLFAEHRLGAPWALCPMTTDLDKAREWLEQWTAVGGVEGVVIKGLEQRYRPGSRTGWHKVRRRDSTEAIIGAVTGSLRHPQTLLLGRVDEAGKLRFVGRTTSLASDAAVLLAEQLTPAGPGHPWTGVRFTASWGSREVLHPVLVRPELVAEVSADTAVDRGRFRHPLRFRRVRPDVAASDVPILGVGGRPAAG